MVCRTMPNQATPGRAKSFVIHLKTTEELPIYNMSEDVTARLAFCPERVHTLICQGGVMSILQEYSPGWCGSVD